MTGKSLDKIKGLSFDDKEILTKAYITSIEKLWSEMAENPRSIDSLPFRSHDDKKRVMIEFATYAKQRSRSVTKSFIGDHLPDAVILAVLVLLGWAFCSFRHIPVVKAKDDIPAFHVITEADILRLGAGHNSYPLEEIVGRYPTDAIAAETVIDPSKLSRGPRLSNELDGLRILNVKLQSTPLLSGIAPPVKLDLIGSVVTKPDSGNPQIYSVYLLNSRLQPDGLWVVIGTPESAATALASASQLSVVGHAH
jgi:hypothetical protein